MRVLFKHGRAADRGNTMVLHLPLQNMRTWMMRRGTSSRSKRRFPSTREILGYGVSESNTE